MTDVREAMTELVRGEEPRAPGPERVRADARNRRMRQRVAATILGLAVAVGATSLAVRGFWIDDRTPHPALPQPIDVSSLHRIWSADVPGASFVAFENVGGDSDHVYVGTTTGVIAYPKDCQDPCAPVWRGTIVQEPSREAASIAVGEGVVAATLDGRLSVFPAACDEEATSCTPLWHAALPAGSNGYSVPLIGGGVVKATLSIGEMPNHHVWSIGFETRCRLDGDSCDPAWRGDMGVGTAFYPAPFVDGVFYQQVGLRMFGFAANCGQGGGSCEPDLAVTLDGEPGSGASTFFGPISDGREVVLTTGTGLIESFPAHCRDSCDPLWVGDASGYNGLPVRAADLAVVSGERGTAAFSFGCRSDGGRCTPRWVTNAGSGGLDWADDQTVVTVGANNVLVLPTDCRIVCEPNWSVAGLGEIHQVTSDGQTLFLAHNQEVLAYPIDCADPCDALWRAAIPGKAWNLLLDERHLITVSQPDKYGDRTVVTTFAAGS